MNDFDWLAGFHGQDSWTHWSTHPDTKLAKALQGDVSAAASFYGDDSFGLSAIAGYRYMTMKWDARGGSYLYSTNAWRDTSGTFPDQTGIAYQQWWQTPYLGLGATMSVDELSVTGEAIAGFTTKSQDKDYHALRTTLFEDKFGSSRMWGGTLGVEYRLSPLLSAVGRVEYQRYFEAEASTKLTHAPSGTTLFFPKGAAGADSETMLVSLGEGAALITAPRRRSGRTAPSSRLPTSARRAQG
jgi:plasminogen activator